MSRWTFELRFVPEPAALTDMTLLQGEALEVLLSGLGASMSITGWRVHDGEIGHRLDVRLWGNGELEIVARMDARSSDSDRFVRELCMCARALHCRLFSVELGEGLEAEAEAVKDALRRSTAWRLAASGGPLVH